MPSVIRPLQFCFATRIFSLGPVYTCVGCVRPRSHRMQSTLRKAPRKQWDTLLQMGVFTQVAHNIKGFAHKFACKSAYAFCVNWASAHLHANLCANPLMLLESWVNTPIGKNWFHLFAFVCCQVLRVLCELGLSFWHKARMQHAFVTAHPLFTVVVPHRIVLPHRRFLFHLCSF